MNQEKSNLRNRIESGEPILLAELSPPTTGDPTLIRSAVQSYAGMVHAIGISDNRDQVGMSAVAASVLALDCGIEPILHVVTRDRNRIALVSDFLGAQALGIQNVLCTSGMHQTLGSFRTAKNVFDIDSTQLLQTYATLPSDASVIGQSSVNGYGPVCLGAVAPVHADPLELQMIRLVKKVAAGAQFLITQPIFDFERFDLWWKEVTTLGLQQKVAIVAGIELLTDASAATAYAQRRPRPHIPDSTLQRLAAVAEQTAQRAVGIELAVESIQRLANNAGIRGYQIVGHGDDEAVREVIEKSGLGSH